MPHPLILLGAGASVEAGIPTAIGMTTAVIDWLEKQRRHSQVMLLRYVAATLNLDRSKKGLDPFSGLNIEDLLAALKMLAQRTEMQLAPFVYQWSPFIDKLESPEPGTYLYDGLERAFREAIENGRSNPFATRRFRNKLEAVLDRASWRRSPVFADAATFVTRALIDRLWLHDPECVTYLKPLVKAAAEKSLTVATLNYDNTVELAASHTGVPVQTGIEGWSQTGLFEAPGDGIELLKLHGSINWRHRYEHHSDDAPLPHDVVDRLTEVPEGRPYEPAIILGAGNKLTAHGPYLELLRTFKHRLEDVEDLLVVGYSFGDDHVNEALYGWMNRQSTRRIVIIDRPGLNVEHHPFHRQFSRHLDGRLNILPLGTGAGLTAYFTL